MAENSESELRQRLQRIETLLQSVERFKHPEDRARTKEIVQTLMDFHGTAVAKMLDLMASSGEAGLRQIEAVAKDELVASLLLLYGLHPLELETRVNQALEKVRPYLHSHGGNVELLGISEGVVRLSLQGSCHGCPSSAITLKKTIEEAIWDKAPDAAGIEVEQEAAVESHEPAAAGVRVGLPILA